MKKLFLIAATSTALLTSATSFADVGQFYIKAEGGATKLNNTKMKWDDVEIKKEDSLKLKSKTNAILGLGAGYYAMDNVRAELTLDFLVNPEFTNSISKTSGATEKATAKGQVMSLLLSGYVDLYDAGFAKFFAGAGIGMAQVKEKISVERTKDSKKLSEGSVTKKPANNFAYQLTVGASANVADGVNVELAYSWRDYGESNSKNKDKKETVKLPKTAYRGHNLMAGLRFDI
ncbi:MAG: outer membrane beta-barrel protein [Candidatus Tisiphia sp.]|uniref:outer membrane beta-barrel protein n=1 Tax=Candidatus Tisiphia endosymbiont of Melanophora roralis TaxID=3066261 RepID=UPI00312C93AA